MYCKNCNKDVGAAGVVQDDQSVLCYSCDQEAHRITFDGPSAETNISHTDPRERKAALSALRAYGQKKSPTIRARKHAERAARVGSDSRALGAGMAILGASDDDPYVFAAGLHINQAGSIRAAQAQAHVAAHGPQRVSPADPALIRLLAERGGDLGRQPVRSKVAATRWIDTVRSARLDSDGTARGELVFAQLGKSRRYALTFDASVGMWTFDIETEAETGVR